MPKPQIPFARKALPLVKEWDMGLLKLRWLLAKEPASAAIVHPTAALLIECLQGTYMLRPDVICPLPLSGLRLDLGSYCLHVMRGWVLTN